MLGRIVLVIVGLGAFVALGGGLLVWCLRGATGEQKPTASALAQVHPKEKSSETQAVTQPVKAPVKSAPVITKKETDLIDTMKRKGIEFLKKTQAADGTWSDPLFGLHLVGMAGLTLLECGVPAHDPAVQRAANLVRQKREPKDDQYVTYRVALQVLFLDKLNDPKDTELIQHLTLRLLRGQRENGGWGYQASPFDLKDEKIALKLLQEVGTTPWRTFAAKNAARVASLPGAVRSLAVFNEPEQQKAEFYKGEATDNSNTQFALLALWAARRHKVPVDLALQLIVKRFRLSQEADGRWLYGAHAPGAPAQAMTCAGLLALAVGYGLETPGLAPHKSPQSDPAITNAFTYLAGWIGTPHKDARNKPDPVPYYFLWSVERVGVLFGQSKIGDRDWFRWGLSILQPNQKNDGSFLPADEKQATTVSDTCFALLFLQQVNLAQDLTDKLEALRQLQATAIKE